MAQVSAMQMNRLPRAVSLRAEVQSRRVPRPAVRLFFPIQARALRTSFRAEVLHTIYSAAANELGGSLVSGSVTTWSQPDEADSTVLVLDIVTDTDRAELERVSRSILDAIAKEAESWTDAEKQDYSQRITFTLGVSEP